MLVRLLVCLALSQHLLCAGESRVCYKEMRPKFRCYSLKAPFTNSFYHLPYSPSAQKIQFQLFTVHNRHTPDYLDALDSTNLTNSHFNGQLDTKVIVHGFMSHSRYDWIPKMVEQLLNYTAMNVIVVDWAEGAKGPNYYQAVANTRVVGAQIASLVLTAEELGSSAARFHVIGHSLGAQTAGYVGSGLKGRLGRISGLDAAAPRFEGWGKKVKLDKTDAVFVDAIHTDAKPISRGGFGTTEPIGHVDFFPNGGSDMPGCTAAKLSKRGNIGCSHMRAPLYYLASIRDNDFLSYPCRSPDGGCSRCGASGCANMGYHASPNSSGIYVTTTQAEYPF